MFQMDRVPTEENKVPRFRMCVYVYIYIYIYIKPIWKKTKFGSPRNQGGEQGPACKQQRTQSRENSTNNTITETHAILPLDKNSSKGTL